MPTRPPSDSPTVGVNSLGRPIKASQMETTFGSKKKKNRGTTLGTQEVPKISFDWKEPGISKDLIAYRYVATYHQSAGVEKEGPLITSIRTMKKKDILEFMAQHKALEEAWEKEKAMKNPTGEVKEMDQRTEKVVELIDKWLEKHYQDAIERANTLVEPAAKPFF